jgi:biopolymer transport protein ExbB/TolQ
MNLHLRIAVFGTVALMVFSFMAIEKSNQKSYGSSAKGICIALIIHNMLFIM